MLQASVTFAAVFVNFFALLPGLSWSVIKQGL
jgi:hypothetical protein